MGSWLKASASITPHKLKSSRLVAISQEFCFQKEEIHRLYECFGAHQKKAEAYITLDDLAETLHYGHLHFSEMPYLERLFKIITRNTPGKLFFEDYVTGISTFCLMNSESVLHFVFDWLDQDSDGVVEKQDIRRALEYINPLTGQKTFFCDFGREVEALLKSRQQNLQFEEFRQISNRLLFLVWPAYQLQQILRDRNLGVQYWQAQSRNIQRAQLAQRKNQTLSGHMKEKVLKLTELKVPPMTLSLTQQAINRTPNEASTDFQLLPKRQRERRRSCPYLRINLIQAASEEVRELEQQ